MKENNLPENIEKEPIHINHKDLERSGDGVYKSVCPVCDNGLLLMTRDDTFKLNKYDRCISCGQKFIYDDLEYLKF